jgi:hypothetical protein
MIAKPFWMVCRTPRHEGAKTEPRQRYTTLDEARRAAATLAAEHDAPFTILAAVETAWPRSQQDRLL